MARGGKAESMVRRKAFAYGLIRKFTGRPVRYGSAKWLALEDGCAEKVAAVCVAAEAWASTGDTLEEDLRHELEEMSRIHKRLDDEENVERAAAHRREYGRLSVVPPRDDLETRVAKARMSRPGDYRPRRGDDLDAG